MNWFDIVKISEDELDSVKPWIKDELEEGKKDRAAAYNRIRNRLGRNPTLEEISQELKLKPHRIKHGSNTDSNKKRWRRVYNRLLYRLGRTPTREEVLAELETPTFRGYSSFNDPGRESRQKRKKELKEKYPNPSINLRIPESGGDFRFNTIEQFIAEFFDYNLMNIAGKTNRSVNNRFIHNQKYLERLTDNELTALFNIKDDLPKLVNKLLALLDKHKGIKPKSIKPKSKKKKVPKKDDLSDRRDIL